MTDEASEHGDGRPGGRVRRTASKAWDGLARGVRKAVALLVEAIRGFLRHRGTKFSAAISYYALLSLVPIAILLAAAFGLIVGEEEARERVVELVFEQLPEGTEKGRDELDSVIGNVTDDAGTLGVAGAIGLLITASALMGSARHAINVAFETRSRRSPLRAKGLDVLMVLGLGLLVGLSIAATVVRDFAIDLGNGLGVPGEVLQVAVDSTGGLFAFALSAAAFAVAYKIFPFRHVPWRDVWPAVAFAAIAYELAKRGFTLYLENFANYNAIYGALGSVVAVLVFVYASAIVLLIGAEMAALWPRVRAGDYDPAAGRTVSRRGGVRGFVIGLFNRGDEDPGTRGETADRDRAASVSLDERR